MFKICHKEYKSRFVENHLRKLTSYGMIYMLCNTGKFWSQFCIEKSFAKQRIKLDEAMKKVLRRKHVLKVKCPSYSIILSRMIWRQHLKYVNNNTSLQTQLDRILKHYRELNSLTFIEWVGRFRRAMKLTNHKSQFKFWRLSYVLWKLIVSESSSQCKWQKTTFWNFLHKSSNFLQYKFLIKLWFKLIALNCSTIN